MSDEEESNVNSEEEQQQEDENCQEQQDEDQEDEDQQDQDADQDQDQEQSGNQDQEQSDDDEGSGDDQNQQKSGEENNEDQNKNLPTFKMVNREPPQQFKFTSLLSQIANLSNNVDNFIGTFHSSASTGFPRRSYATDINTQQQIYQPRLQQTKPLEPSAQSRVVIMKDQDTQVDMKPQIIIQPTRSVKEDPIIQAKPYKISTESEKFLAQIYEQNKKLKRWQVNPNHAMSSYMSSYTGSNGFGGSNRGFYGSKDKFQRKQYEKGGIQH